MQQPDQAIEQNLKAIHQYQDEIKLLEKAIWDAKYYVVNRVGQVMQENGFLAGNWYLAAWKHYYKEVEGRKLPLRIYIELQQLALKNELRTVIELYDDFTSLGEDVIKRIEGQNLYEKAGGLMKGTGKGGGWFHIAEIVTPVENRENDFEAAFRRAISPFFAKTIDGKSFLEHALEIVDGILVEKKEQA